MGTTRPGGRIVSLDQFRGYTVLGMFVVNFLGPYAATPEFLKHHNDQVVCGSYCGYADTIMPQFFFAVGFAYRLTLLRRLRDEGPGVAYRRVLRRNLGLILLGVVLHHLDGDFKSWEGLRQLGWRGFFEQSFQRNVFQTLVHIGVTAIWVLPVITAGSLTRVAFAGLSAGLYVLATRAGYYEWVMRRPGIDGGPLGFLTWTIPMLTGSLAYDAIAPAAVAGGLGRAAGRLLGWAALLMAVGYGIACLNLVTPPNEVPDGAGAAAYMVEPPFVPPSRPINVWTMCQRSGSLSYQVFAAGFSLAVYALFVWACDVFGWRWGPFGTFGSNALAAYVIHDLVMEAMRPLTPRDAPGWFVLAATGVFLGVCYLFVRSLERNNVYIRL